MSELKYAAIESRSIHHEGDQRSRDCPGHGYPERTETVTTFVPFKSREEMERYAERETRYGHQPKLIEYRELAVKTTTTVVVSP